MRRIISLFLFAFLLNSCAVTRKIENDQIQLRFLDEYVLASDTEFQNTIVGGLSGIDYKSGKYYLVSDQASNPRIYEANISIDKQKFQNVSIEKLIKVQKNEEFQDEVLDLEALRLDEMRDEFIVTSEGKIDEDKNPGIYRLSYNGEIQSAFKIPQYFKAEDEQKPRNNGVFEGITESFDQQGYWVATESPLEKDSSKPKIFPSRSHVRITKFDKNTGEPTNRSFVISAINRIKINIF